MMVKIYKMSAFSEGNKGGNPAGVVIDTNALTENEMQTIAHQVGYSETAFVSSSEVADFKVRFFTPVNEVDLCGHATIATFNLLRDLKIITPGKYTQETKAGVLKVYVNPNEVLMEQTKPVFSEVLKPAAVKACFEEIELDLALPVQVVSTGLRDIFVPVKSLDNLMKLMPKLDVITALSKKYDASGLHVFCLESFHDHDANARNFAPLFGIDEESATGTSNGALSSYLMKYRKDDYNGEFVIKQGYSMDMPSRITTKIVIENDDIINVLVGGTARKL
jgi:PhzF family phenazine biosynthesis protein